MNSKAFNDSHSEAEKALLYRSRVLCDSKRLAAFQKAIEFHVKAGMQVLELGAGTGILSFFAAKQGAKVTCVEKDSKIAEAAEALLKLNDCSAVKVLNADPMSFMPDATVDVVICDMLYPGLFSEKQIPVLAAFKNNYAERFGAASLPLIIPEATILAVQPVQYPFEFFGYTVPAPLLFDAYAEDESILDLGDPILYGSFEYRKSLPLDFSWSGNISIKNAGHFTALRLVTKNLLGIFVESNSSLDWHDEYLLIPLPKAKEVKAGEIVRLTFSYEAGGNLDSMMQSIELSS